MKLPLLRKPLLQLLQKKLPLLMQSKSERRGKHE